jgi:hypothetical protein
MMTEPFLTENFIEHESFPYDPEPYLGKETAMLNVFTFWKHYSERYRKQLEEAKILEDEYYEWQKKEG